MKELLGKLETAAAWHLLTHPSRVYARKLVVKALASLEAGKLRDAAMWLHCAADASDDPLARVLAEMRLLLAAADDNDNRAADLAEGQREYDRWEACKASRS